ncbi:hypothetical protein DP115_25800 [Brasilonema octagenarum UFV-OR1]|uniref:Uncharacterized protein n=1 Tax=Brasilonema octagenarum UFV-OR1 TaxID=417115 RepID=A0ABX1MBI9_9CYAN|nr:hypothetical protein [Brasilonema octagenarum UFV-OR1]
MLDEVTTTGCGRVTLVQDKSVSPPPDAAHSLLACALRTPEGEQKVYLASSKIKYELYRLFIYIENKKIISMEKFCIKFAQE